jgi:WD40 repeat protein
LSGDAIDALERGLSEADAEEADQFDLAIASPSYEAELPNMMVDIDAALSQHICHDSPISFLSFGRGARTVLAGDATGCLKKWDLESGRVLRAYAGRHQAGITWCQIVQESVVSASEDGMIVIWDDGGAVRHEMHAHSGRVNCVDIDRNAMHKLLSGGSDATLKLWDLRTGGELMCLDGHTDAVTKCVFMHESLALLSASHDGTLKLWDAETGELDTTLSGHTGAILDWSISSDGRMIASASLDGTVRLWDSATCVCLGVIDLGGGIPVKCRICCDARYILINDDSGQLAEWSCVDLTQQVSLVLGAGSILDFMYSSDALFICSIADDSTISWFYRDGTELGVMPTTGTPTGLFIENDALLYAVTDDLGQLYLFEEPGAEDRRPLVGPASTPKAESGQAETPKSRRPASARPRRS